MDTQLDRLHPDLAFWCLLPLEQQILLAPVREGCSAEQMLSSYYTLFGHMTEDHHSELAFLLGTYLGGLLAYQHWRKQA